MKPIKLSICIPTYNFGDFIGETLKSVIDQAGDDVEIVVVDGASTDNTGAVVRDFQKRFPRLHHHLLAKKGGIDKDIAKTVDLAQGEYCWLLSSDDVLKSGAIERVRREIAAGHAVYLCNRIECDINMNPVYNRSWFSRTTDDSVFDLSTKSGLLDYFNKATSIGALFSYMSSIIVRRDTWNKTAYDERFTGTNYAHAYRLFTMLLNGGQLRYIKEPLVFCRGEHDSFLEKGFARRFLIDLDGYRTLGSHFFQDDVIQRAFHAVIRREFRWYIFAGVRSESTGEEWNAIERKLLTLGYSRNGLTIVRMLGSSKPLVLMARRLRAALRRLMLNKTAKKQ